MDQKGRGNGQNKGGYPYAITHSRDTLRQKEKKEKQKKQRKQKKQKKQKKQENNLELRVWPVAKL